ncbi:MAG: YjbQ family protein [Magnetococcales bacterium]|nr:YjbQ family protein [Magnetococcales bacterium]
MPARLTITTQRPQQLLDITAQVSQWLANSGKKEGILHLFVPHTTAGITLNENCDPDVMLDILTTLEKLIPTHGDYRHGEGNSHAHLKSTLTGHQVAIPFANGQLLLGRWQGIYFAEFDGPRQRELILHAV